MHGVGHPKKGEVREKLVNVIFKANQQTLTELAALEASFDPDAKGGKRSTTIRNVIHEAWLRLTGRRRAR